MFEPQVGLGVTFGEVLETDATQYMVRVSVSDLEVDGSSHEGWWCQIMTPMAGPKAGFFNLPQVGDLVVVAFHNGDPNNGGVVLGGYWGVPDTMGAAAHEVPVVDDGTSHTRGWVTPMGRQIILSDKSGAETITICDTDGDGNPVNSVVLDSTNKGFAVTVEGDVTITAKSNIILDVTDGTFTVKCKSFGVEASADVAIKGNGITLEDQGELMLKGTVGVKVDGMMDVNAGALKVLK